MRVAYQVVGWEGGHIYIARPDISERRTRQER